HRGRVTRAALQLGEERADVWPAADHRPLANLPPQGDGFQQAELGAGEDGDAAPGPPLRVGAYLAADRRQLGSPYSLPVAEDAAVGTALGEHVVELGWHPPALRRIEGHVEIHGDDCPVGRTHAKQPRDARGVDHDELPGPSPLSTLAVGPGTTTDSWLSSNQRTTYGGVPSGCVTSVTTPTRRRSP